MHFCHCGNHAWKELNRGFVALVSVSDAPVLDGNWYAAVDARHYWTVRRNIRLEAGGPRKQERLARVVATPPRGLVVDHVNLNTFDNRRANLRVCTDGENRLNTRARRGKAVGLKGVRQGKSGTFQALITRGGRQFYLGTFISASAAHEAYVRAAEQLHGEFGRAE